jgi:hypothetical protein
MLRIPLFPGHPSWSMTSCMLLTFLLVQLKAGQSEHSKSSTNYWSLWNMHTIQRFVVYPWHHNKRLFEAFHTSQKLVFQGYNTTWCKFSVLLRSAIPLGYNRHKMHSAQTHLNVNCTNPGSVRVTPHLFTIQSIQQYLVAHSCITCIAS